MRWTLHRFGPVYALTACAILTAAGVLTWSGCRSAPVTGRRQLLVVPEQQEITMGATAYQEVLAKEQPSARQDLAEIVERVGRRIAEVAGRPDYEWEFRLIKSDQQNAFALPGGKTAIYEGILPVCQTEAGLAVVMSHEIAHALNRHGGERMSQNMVSTGVQKAVAMATQSKEEKDREMIMQAYGVVSKYGAILPYSRKHESEADHVGLMLMAQAGYDPSEAPRFWERFGSAGGEKPPEFLSTHPSDARRAADLRSLLPEAMELYKQAPIRHGAGEVLKTEAAAQ